MALDFGVYSNKVCTADKAVTTVQSGSHVFVGTACATPRLLLGALEALSTPPRDVTILSFLTDAALPLSEGKTITNYKHKCFFVGTEMRNAIQQGVADYIPISLAELPRHIKNGRFPIEVALVQVSAPDRNGFVSLGVSVDITLIAARYAKKIIAEINPNMPFTFGDSAIHLSRFDQLVINDSPIYEYTHPPADDVAEQIASYIAGIINDESTLQIGLGRIPNAMVHYLFDRRDLGIHTDVITDWILDLIEKGVITGRKKTLSPDKVVTSYCMGSKRLYDFIHLNPLFEFRPIDYICDPFIISKNHRMVSISQAFAVDLTGQVCSDQLCGQFYGGVSTQPEFLRGAARSPGGKPIICLRSTTEDGKESLIRPQLLQGEGVGISRADVHYVVTEYGLAYLFGKSIRQRAISLIEIAAPKFRPWLLECAKQMGYLPAQQTLRSDKPYLIKEECTIVLRNGETVRLRPSRASDSEAILELFHALSEEDIYMRFFQRLRTLTFNQTQQLCNVNLETEAAFIAAVGERESEKIIGSSCYFLNLSTNIAEAGFMVAPEWRGRGLGTALQNNMVEHAKAHGIRGFSAVILSCNAKAMALVQKGGKNLEIFRDGEVYEVTNYF